MTNKKEETHKETMFQERQITLDEVHKQLKLSDLVIIPKDKILTSTLSPYEYISTENMLSDFGGISYLESLPKTEKVNKFSKGDILISNIRPYLKKIWLATFDGGCSTDVIVLHPKNLNNSQYIFYALSTERFFNYMMRTSKGTKMPRGDKKAVLKYNIKLINDNLKNNGLNLISSLDYKINLMEKKQEQYQNMKKYFLQNMFPNNSETIPKIRFSEYKEKWQQYKLKDLCNNIGDGLHSTPNYINNSKYYFINGNNLVNGKIKINKDTKRVPFNQYNKYKIDLNENTILLSINGTIGNLSFYNNEQVILGKSVAYINLKNKSLKRFMYYYLQTEKIRYYFKSELTGSTIKNLSLKSLKNTSVYLPSEKEYVKIASFLSTIDQKIQYAIKRRTYLTEFKKGLLQKMFC